MFLNAVFRVLIIRMKDYVLLQASSKKCFEILKRPVYLGNAF